MHLVTATSPSVWAEPGTLGFLVVFGMGVVLFFVFRSMSRHLRKVRQAAQLEAEQAEQAEQAGQSEANAK
jgi:TRAP-type C4-dicarboxylate transport system permease small subunit